MKTDNSIQNNAYDNEISVLSIINLLLKKSKVIIIIILLCSVVGTLQSFLRYKKIYVAKSYILLQQPRRISNDREQYDQDAMQTLVRSTFDLIIKSNQFLSQIALKEYIYHVNGKEVRSNLLKYFNINNLNDSSIADRIKAGIQLNYDKQKMDVVEISYSSTSPEIAAQIANNIVNQLNIFYTTQINDTSKRNLAFLRETLNKTKQELDAMGGKLTVFVKRNKELKNASNTMNFYASKFAFQRLEEAVKLKSELYIELSKEYEELNINSMENTPSVTVLEQALPPQQPLPKHTTKYSILGAFVGFLFSACGVVLLNLREAFYLQKSPIEALEEIQTKLKKDFDRTKDFISSEKNIKMAIYKIKSLLYNLLNNIKILTTKKLKNNKILKKTKDYSK